MVGQPGQPGFIKGLVLENTLNPDIIMLLIMGSLIILNSLIRSLFDRLGLPALVGFIVLGLSLGWMDHHWNLLQDNGRFAFQLLANFGLVGLLFNVGLKSELQGLIAKLPMASRIVLGGIFLPGILGFITAFYLIHLDVVPSLVISVALTATSVGVSVNLWQEANLMHTDLGQLLLDIAELDDIIGILLMTVLVALIPLLLSHHSTSIAPVIFKTGLTVFIKLLIFAGCVYLFAHFLEHPLVKQLKRLETPPGSMLTVSGISMITAAIAAGFGFSLAIGALFAGLVFSARPDSVRDKPEFEQLYELFVPFFFIGLGLSIDIDSLVSGLSLGLILLLPAVAGKLFGAGLLTWWYIGRNEGVLIGASMVPRAEIAMVVVHQASLLGTEAVPERVQTAMVILVAATCLVSPFIVRPLLARQRASTNIARASKP